MSEGVRAGVLVVVFDPTSPDSIIMMRRRGSHGSGTWTCPGGRMEYGEPVEITCSREVWEEVGVSIDTPKYVATTDDFFSEDGQHWVTLWFVAPMVSGTPTLREPDKAEIVCWVKWDREMPDPLFLPWSHVDVSQLRSAAWAYEDSFLRGKNMHVNRSR